MGKLKLPILPSLATNLERKISITVFSVGRSNIRANYFHKKQNYERVDAPDISIIFCTVIGTLFGKFEIPYTRNVVSVPNATTNRTFPLMFRSG